MEYLSYSMYYDKQWDYNDEKRHGPQTQEPDILRYFFTA